MNFIYKINYLYIISNPNKIIPKIAIKTVVNIISLECINFETGRKIVS